MSARSFSLAIVPHAPLLLREIAGEADPCATSRMAATQLLSGGADTVFVLVSPHAERTCVYGKAAGNLSLFGLPGVGAESSTFDRAAALAGAWGQPLVDEPVDHGVLVPMALAPEGSTFVCCGIAESSHGETAVELGTRLARAIHTFQWDGEVTFVASAQSAASLSPRAPLTERPQGAEFDSRLLHLLRSRPSALAESNSVSAELWCEGGSCSQGSLAALGEMARMCNIESFEVLSHEWPVGVGLLVARGIQ